MPLKSIIQSRKNWRKLEIEIPEMLWDNNLRKLDSRCPVEIYTDIVL